MDRNTGVVMERDGDSIVVLTGKGEFRRVKCRGQFPEIGQEITLRAKRKRFTPSSMTWIAAVAAVLLIAFISPLSMMVVQPPEQAIAWVTVDINPSVELTVSNKERVMSAVAINSDGSKILKEVKVLGMDIDDAVAVLTDKATKMGYIAKDKENTVIISVASNDIEFDSLKLEQKLVIAAQGVLTGEKMVAVVQTVKATGEFREQARKKELSMGKYAVLIEAVNSGIMISEEEIKDNSITDIIKKAGGKPEEILKKAHEEKVEQLPEKEKKYQMIASERDRNRIAEEQPGATEEPNPSGTNPNERLPMINPINRPTDAERVPTPTPGEQPAEEKDTPSSDPQGDGTTGSEPKLPNDIGTGIDNTRQRDNSMN